MPAKRTPNIDFMNGYVEDYLEGRMERWVFDLDFDHHVIARYEKMEREDPDYAEAFGFYISEFGVDAGGGLSDAAYKKLIRKQYKELKGVAAEGYL